MKLLNTESYLLLIQEEAEIKTNDYILEKELIINIFPNYLTDLDECSKIIAYYPLTKEAKELDLLLLPNPFNSWETSLKDIEINDENLFSMLDKLSFQLGYKAATKQFSLEDMKKAIVFGVENAPTIETHTKMISNKDYRYFVLEELINKYVQSLSTQQLPKEFIPEYRYYYHSSKEFYSDAGFVECSKEQYESIKAEIPKCPLKAELKTITNSEGKQELVGTYKY